MIKGIILLIQFFTRIPIPVTVDYDEKTYVRNTIFVPLVGAIIGLALAGTYYIFNLAGLPLIGAAAVVSAGVLLTGGLHLDGLADTADGFYSYRPRERMLEIMRDSRIGSNGTLALIILILFKTALILSLGERMAVFYIFIMPVYSRMSIPWLCRVSEYARDDAGMGSAIVNFTGKREVILATVIGLGLTLPLFYHEEIAVPLLAAGAAVLFALYTSYYSKKKIGGITGDVIGAMVELSEVVCLLTCIAAVKILSGALI